MNRLVGGWWRAAVRASVPLALVLSSLASASQAQAQTPLFNRTQPQTTAGAGEIVPGQLVIRLKPSLAIRAQRSQQPGFELGALLGRRDVTVARTIGSDTYQLKVAAGADVQALVAQLSANPDVQYAEPVYIMHATGGRQASRVSGDPLVGRQWALSKIQAPDAWELSVGAEGLIVASVDTGVNPNHPDLAGRVLPGYNFVSNTADAMDDNSHGTFGAGIIAAPGDNGVGVAGMCWRCQILPVKVLDNEGGGYSPGIALGIRWAADHGARIINLSLGGPGPSQLIHESIQYAVSKGILVIAAAGNEADEDNPVEYPAAFDEVFSVGATDENNSRTFFSNYGPYLDLTAPGLHITSTGGEGDLYGYASESGTSFSAPYVSGAAALIWSINPQLSDRDVMRLLAQSADDLGKPGPDDEYGFGRLNAGKAALAAKQTAAPPPPAPPSEGGSITFPETNHTLQGTFYQYWKGNGGLPVFGFPIDEQHVETSAEGTFWVQTFERNRLEFHPEKQPPYNVLLGRLGDAILKRQGRDWFTFPKGTAGTPDCQFFDATQHAVCGPFLKYWREHGLSDPKLDAVGRSLQLWGLPLSEPMMETNSSGDTVMTQWFERARFEDHGAQGILLGLLGNELARPASPPPPPPPSTQCDGIPTPISGSNSAVQLYHRGVADLNGH